MDRPELVLFAVVAGAAATPFAARRFRVPAVALEIAYGTVLFRILALEIPDWFHLLSEIGFIYLMFIAGMELDLHSLFQSGRAPRHALIVALGFLLAPSVFAAAGSSFYLGITVAVMSAGIVLPVLKESGLVRSPIGQDIVGIALVGELISIAVLTGVDTYRAYGLTGAAVYEVTLVAAAGVLGYLALKLLHVVSWWNADRVEKVMESQDPTEEGIRLVIAVAFGGALLAYTAGTEPILGSFMAGVVFSYVFRNRGRFEDKINAVGFGFFTPFFFMGIGAELDIHLLAAPSVLLQSAVLTAAVLASRAPIWLFLRTLAIRPAEALGMSLLLATPLTMMVVAGTLGERMGYLTPESGTAVVLAAVLASILYPSVFRAMIGRLLAHAQPSRVPSPRLKSGSSFRR